MDKAESDEDDFVSVGNPLPHVDDEESLRHLAAASKLKAQKVTDDQGRERFHGAFTGGFSAGYYNTVGSKEGWAPTTFKSSRQIRSADNQRKPEDFMDDEDLAQFGIAPRDITAKPGFLATATIDTGGVGGRHRAPIASGSVQAALADLITPARTPIAYKLLQAMGWKPGQGTGARIKRRPKSSLPHPGRRIYGCSMGPAEAEPATFGTAGIGGGSDGDDDDDDDDGFLLSVSFAPKDVNPVSLKSKDDFHGLGYVGLRADLYESGGGGGGSQKREKGHRQGEAFGIGALEDDDDAEVYSTERMSDYSSVLVDPLDDEIEVAAGDVRGKKKPAAAQPSAKRAPGYSTAVLDGFRLAGEAKSQQAVYPAPTLPRGYVPRCPLLPQPPPPPLPASLQQRQQPHGSAGGGGAGASGSNRLDSFQRKVLLGESLTGYMGIGLIAAAAPQPAAADAGKAGSGESCSVAAAMPPPSTALQPRLTLAAGAHLHSPLAPAVAFKPFAKNPDKQERYERFVVLLKQGSKDPHREVADPMMNRGEREREREEFVRSARFYSSSSSLLSNRFSRAKNHDDDTTEEVTVDQETDKSDQMKAVEMKLFGRLTREDYEWHPHKLVCKRFNIAHPYPGSSLVGLPTIKKDKVTVYNFLNATQLNKPIENDTAETSLFASPAVTSSSAPSILALPPISGVANTSSGDATAVQQPSAEPPPLDLFKSIFADSDDEEVDAVASATGSTVVAVSDTPAAGAADAHVETSASGVQRSSAAAYGTDDRGSERPVGSVDAEPASEGRGSADRVSLPWLGKSSSRDGNRRSAAAVPVAELDDRSMRLGGGAEAEQDRGRRNRSRWGPPPPIESPRRDSQDAARESFARRGQSPTGDVDRSLVPSVRFARAKSRSPDGGSNSSTRSSSSGSRDGRARVDDDSDTEYGPALPPAVPSGGSTGVVTGQSISDRTDKQRKQKKKKHKKEKKKKHKRKKERSKPRSA